MTFSDQIESLRAQIQNMPSQVIISKAIALGMLEKQPVYARMNDDSEVRVGAIAWTKWLDHDGLTTYSIDDIKYFFIKN
jgi:hypothetical protein